MSERLAFSGRGSRVDTGVVAVIGVSHERRDGAVGQEGVEAPAGEQLDLRSDEPGAAHDQPPAVEFRLGDLRLPVSG